MSDTRNISFQWRTLSVSGVYYIGDQEDGYCETFEVEDITLGEKPLPGFLYDACISGDARTSLDEAAFEQGRNGE